MKTLISIMHIHLLTCFYQSFMNANIIKTQIIHDMKFDHKGHFNIQDLVDFFVPNSIF